MNGYLYRFRDYLVSNYSEDDWGPHYAPPTVKIVLESFIIIKRTPKGVWINADFGQKKFVNLTARKQFACETIEQAKTSYIARKKRQIRIYKERLSQAESALKIIINTKDKKDIQNNVDITDLTIYTNITLLEE